MVDELNSSCVYETLEKLSREACLLGVLKEFSRNDQKLVSPVL